jgi:plastocyanin
MPRMSQLKEAFVIVENDGRTEVGSCAGPDELGHCPKVAWGDVVPCAGRQLRPKALKGMDGLRVVVPALEDACPIPSVQPAKRSPFVLMGLAAIIGLVAGAAIAIPGTLAMAGGNSRLLSSSTSAAAAQTSVPAAQPTSVSIAVPADRFSPAYLTISAGTTVTWHNTDTDPHTVTTAPGLAPVPLELVLAPGGAASFHFTKPGLYVVYCKDHAVWDTATGLPKALPGTDIYPEAMAGAILVQPASR